MKILKCLLIFLLVAVSSCNDPSLDNNNDATGSGIPDTIDDAVRLSGFTVALDNVANINDTYTINYDTDNLITSVARTGTVNETFNFTYASNDRITAYEYTSGAIIENTTLTYSGNEITATTLIATDTVKASYTIDDQNRIDRIFQEELDNTGMTTFIEDVRFLYNDNNNVARINALSENGSLIERKDLTYVLFNNPFMDMNDIVRLVVFKDFIPQSRFLPSQIMTTNSTLAVQESSTIIYEVNNIEFPITAMRQNTAGGITQDVFYSYTY